MIALLRHGATAGNLERRYVGSTDEGLSSEGILTLKDIRYPGADRVFVSPMKRALETARLIYPDAAITPVEGFRECDFGDFEYKNAPELSSDARYQAWIDSGGTLPFPGGESRAAFVRRSLLAFDAIAHLLTGDCAIIAHGGTLMAILSERALPRRGYFFYQVPCAHGFLCARNTGALHIVRSIDL